MFDFDKIMRYGAIPVLLQIAARRFTIAKIRINALSIMRIIDIFYECRYL